MYRPKKNFFPENFRFKSP